MGTRAQSTHGERVVTCLGHSVFHSEVFLNGYVIVFGTQKRSGFWGQKHLRHGWGHLLGAGVVQEGRLTRLTTPLSEEEIRAVERHVLDTLSRMRGGHDEGRT